MSSAATVLGTRLGARLGTSIGVESTPESRLLDRLATIPDAVWFDPALDAGVLREDDGGTWRITSVLSRPIHTQYTVSQATLSIAPAEAFSPSGKRILSFAGAQYLWGAAALAALLQGSAAYSEVQIGARAAGGTTARWSAGLVAASPSNRIAHYVGGSNLVTRLRDQASTQTQNTGATVTADSVSRLYSNTYSGSVYAGWVNDVAETLSGSGVNIRAPATLDLLAIGALLTAGAAGGFWNGSLSGLILTPGHVLSTDDRVAIQADLAAYHGY
jgi:hypothetical protein